MLMKAIRWSNGMVTAFDERGQQIPELQGHLEDVAWRVLRDAIPDTKFYQGDFRSGSMVEIPREQFHPDKYSPHTEDETPPASAPRRDDDDPIVDGFAAVAKMAEDSYRNDDDSTTASPSPSFSGGGGDFGGAGASGDFSTTVDVADTGGSSVSTVDVDTGSSSDPGGEPSGTSGND